MGSVPPPTRLSHLAALFKPRYLIPISISLPCPSSTFSTTYGVGPHSTTTTPPQATSQPCSTFNASIPQFHPINLVP